MAKRTTTTSKLMTIKVIPTTDIMCAREGGSTKFGWSLLRFGVKVDIETLVRDGKDCIAAGRERIYQIKSSKLEKDDFHQS